VLPSHLWFRKDDHENLYDQVGNAFLWREVGGGFEKHDTRVSTDTFHRFGQWSVYLSLIYFQFKLDK
jgi:hypothetical protein